MLKLALLTAGIVALSLVLLSVNILLQGGTFRGVHIGQSKALRGKGIRCVHSADIAERREDPHRAVKRERGIK